MYNKLMMTIVLGLSLTMVCTNRFTTGYRPFSREASSNSRTRETGKACGNTRTSEASKAACGNTQASEANRAIIFNTDFPFMAR